MYQGANVTAIQSQQWLASSMTELMEEFPFRSITIGRLCDHAGLSRQTFYNVFDSKEDVLRFCIRNQYEEQFRKYSIKKNMTVEGSVATFVSVVGNSYKLQRLMVRNQLEGIMMDEMNRCVALFSDHFVQQDPRFSYVNAMVNGAMVNLLVYWMKQDDPISIDELTLLIKSFLEGTLFSHAVFQM